MTKLINSRIVALLIGVWIAYCLGVKAYDGAAFLLISYLFALHENKKATNGAKFGDTATVND